MTALFVSCFVAGGLCIVSGGRGANEPAPEAEVMAEVAAGLMGAYEYRMCWYSEDEATARRRALAARGGLRWRCRR